jgi:glutamine amidotransferase-like uncharacterized protein
MKTFLSIVLMVIAFQTQASAAQKALIYKGEGSCSDSCSEAFWQIAIDAGFDPVYVGPGVPAADTFENAAVWIQPGGYASTAMRTMSSQLKTAIRNFIQNGGGYVGYCAGAFTATAKVGTTSNSGLGIFPGRTKLYGSGVDLKTVTWNGSERKIYWEGGPFLRNLPSSVEVIGRYSNGAIATARTTFGSGRVFITGLHPEAPRAWKDDAGHDDTDGDDFDLVIEMLKWVTRQ